MHHFRRAVSIVPQDVVLFDKTIKENLKYGAGGDPTDAEIIAACRQANAWEFIEKKPDGLETRVGARSVANADDLHPAWTQAALTSAVWSVMPGGTA